MTTVRDQLAAALREAAVDRTASVIAAQVDVLLSLPGIAIVELPEPDEDGECWGEAWYVGPGNTSLAPTIWADLERHHFTAPTLRRFAAALLAAANAAEATP